MSGKTEKNEFSLVVRASARKSRPVQINTEDLG